MSLTDRCKQDYIYEYQQQFTDHFKKFINPILVLHKKAKIVASGMPSPTGRDSISHITTTTEIFEVFKPEYYTPCSSVPYAYTFVLEGACGIGKTCMVRHIAFMWAEKQAFKEVKLLILLQFCDPNLHSIRSFEELIEYYCSLHKLQALTHNIASYFSKNQGLGLMLVFDGYDELPQEVAVNLLLNNILQKKLLPHCFIVITSLHFSTENLHKCAYYRVEIVGLSKFDFLNYLASIKSVSSEKLELVKQFFSSNPMIEKLCCIPIDAKALLYLIIHDAPLPIMKMN